MAQPSGSNSESASVLIADDDSLIRMTLRMVAQKHGLTVVDVPDGDEMIARLTDRSFDMCIMDISMSGPTLESRIESMNRLAPEMKVVVLSGSLHQPAELDGTSVVFVSKPIDLAALDTVFGTLHD